MNFGWENFVLYFKLVWYIIYVTDKYRLRAPEWKIIADVMRKILLINVKSLSVCSEFTGIDICDIDKQLLRYDEGLW